jgi:hypothetical protein
MVMVINNNLFGAPGVNHAHPFFPRTDGNYPQDTPVQS